MVKIKTVIYKIVHVTGHRDGIFSFSVNRRKSEFHQLPTLFLLFRSVRFQNCPYACEPKREIEMNCCIWRYHSSAVVKVFQRIAKRHWHEPPSFNIVSKKLISVCINGLGQPLSFINVITTLRLEIEACDLQLNFRLHFLLPNCQNLNRK